MTADYIKTALTVPLCFIFMVCTEAKTPEPTSALMYQQTTNTRIVVEENHLRFFTGGDERMTIDANGNVGIGYTSFDWGTAMDKLVVENGVLAAGLNASAFTYADAEDPTKWFFRSIMYPSDEKLTFESNINGLKKILTFDNSGHVGIGTNSPADNLHIKGDKDLGDEPSIRLSTEKYYGGSGGATNTVLGRIKFVNRDLNYGYRSEIVGLLTGGWADRVGLAFITCSGSQRYERMRIEHTGNVGIGTTDPAYKLHVSGDVRATKFRADGNTWADFVFDSEYQLNELDKVELFIKKNHHLPEIPSAAEVQENGIDIVDMQAKLLQKIEELTLYVIEQNKKIDRLTKENQNQSSRLELQSSTLDKQQKQIEKLKSNRPFE